jgi:hypothetical protein
VPDDPKNDVQPSADSNRPRLDRTSAVMAAVTIVALLTFVWFRIGSSTSGKPLAVGDPAPLLWLVDLDSSEPSPVLGLKGKVVWIVFWSAEAPDAPQSLAAIAHASSKLRAHRRFNMFTAAVGAAKPDRVRAAASQSGAALPIQLASADSIRRFGAENADPPLHVLIDEDGRVIALARGAGHSTLDRLAEQAERRLDELDPQGTTRFALQEPVTGALALLTPVHAEARSRRRRGEWPR